MSEMYDVLLISPWSEPVNVLPSFHITRQLIEKYSNRIAREKTPDFFNNNEGQEDCGNVIRYFEKFPISMGLLCIASALESCGYSVKYLSLDYNKYLSDGDPNWLSNVLKSELDKTRYAVGVTAVTPEFNRAIQILEFSKQLKSELLTVIGGPHVSYLDHEVANLDMVDIVVRGEGEATFCELMEVHTQRGDFASVQGITFKRSGEIYQNPDRLPINLADYPPPAFHLLPLEDIDKFILYTYFGRGCVNNCDYCVEGKYWGNRQRYRTVMDLVNELEYFANVFNWRFIHLIDSDFLLARRLIPELCDELEKRNLGIQLSINVSPKLYKQASPELLKRMIEVGFKEFLIGSESADDQILLGMNRRQSFSDLVRSIEVLNEVQAPFISTYWVVGFPGETHETISKTTQGIIDLFERGLIYHGSTKLFIPYPGTPIYKNPNQYGLILVTNEWERFDRYGFPPPYIHSNLSPFELQHYIMLLQSIQLKYFIKRSGNMEEHMEDLFQACDDLYLKKIYM
ncbi:radical SAM protein [Paenibacillus lutimineralis]|uniref:Radical SAM protein n=2 Tax=Paenibacillus lutimineralis TaxID=2707005 RepID=A0A3Q9ICX4_9BACL|nr:radical SAM protein [Paenibacillus lutimineralis]